MTERVLYRCRGLKVLVDLLDEDYSNQTNLVAHALNGIGSVFELQVRYAIRNVPQNNNFAYRDPHQRMIFVACLSGKGY